MTTGPGIDPAKDGDVYHVTLVDETGNNLTTLDETVTYEVSRPNGPECEPECRHAVIDKRR